jgi:hypothetical protein
MQQPINGLNFQPWISDAYINNTGIYGRLLIIGESHYLDSDNYENEFTTNVVDGYINLQSELHFFRNLGLAFNEENRYEVWDNVAFANGIQVGLENVDSQPTKNDIATFVPAFWKLLEELKPSRVLICSQRMWKSWMPSGDDCCKFIRSLDSNFKPAAVWEYYYNDGKKNCLVMGIDHPSRYFSHKNWAPIIKEFLSIDLEQ